MTTPKDTNEPKPGTRDFYRQEAERLQRQLEALKGVQGDQLVGLNVTIPKRLRDGARKMAQDRGTTLRSVTEEALELYLASEQNDD